MRLLFVSLAVSVLAQPALAREHSRHHHRHLHSAAHSHHWHSAGHRFGGWGYARRARGVLAYAGGFDDFSRHAQANGVPEALVHRVVIRESRYNARAIGRGGAMGLMQIKYSTARAMGYTGSPAGLLDPDTNLTYAVRYLAGAYRVAGGDSGRSVSNYARGYYAGAKRQGFSPYQGGMSGSYAAR